ncbi:cell division protein FtsA [Paenibacillus albus]|uniref:Cell division protein FtsA n=1 Tax=Paenibacillus albus TaxID=2495582 RepID=A0A3Q8X261_9BACL|nr:pilus assembly protein PilM [Paenibacillus albus]AZN38749.1 cell division protein FtsA [Paenibacillus albus]
MSSQIAEIQFKQRVFAVDIGTRSVIGLVGYYENGKLVVEHGEVEYHKDRVMIDGQIHDIDGVTESIRAIKTKLEEVSGQTFTEVAIAAAGRSLITGRARLSQSIDETKPIEKHVIDSLEMEGLQKVYAELLEESQEMQDYFCIGHTVVHYYLNEKTMLSLLGHKGRTIEVDLIATFLPRTVVDSLYAAVSRIGLDVSYLTLEPIAAIEAAVPANIRLLNIALVDIGAGTSDIAITKEGTVVAYAMTATAGDEITEALAQAYLMDFDSAEELKCKLREQPVQRYKDIIGMEYEKPTEDILDQLSEVIDLVAKNIADNVLDKNGKAPSAVFLTGGGSQIPRLNEMLAGYLELPVERVATRDLSNIPNLSVSNFSLRGPEVVTPIGILAKAVSHLGRDFVEVFVNGASVKLINTKTLKVIDALMLVGFNPQQLIARAGKSFEVHLNGRRKTVFGEAGEAGEIYVNGEPSNISTPIKPQDRIVIVPAKHGEKREMTLGKLVHVHAGWKVNGAWMSAVTNVRVNGQAAEGDLLLSDQDVIEYEQLETVADLRRVRGIGKAAVVVYVNGAVAEDSYRIAELDEVMIVEVEAAGDGSGAAFAEVAAARDEAAVAVVVPQVLVAEGADGGGGGGEGGAAEETGSAETSNADEPLEAIEETEPDAAAADDPTIIIMYNGSPLTLPRGLAFVNLFDYVDFDRTKRQGSLLMTHNGEQASYTRPVEAGDVIEVKWV